MQTAGGVSIEIDAGIAVITIDRPDVRNAIGFATIDELDAAFDRVAASEAEVLVVRGGGERAFVSGGDLKELSAIRSHDDAVGMASRIRRVLDRMADLPLPVVAALNGHALGGGAEVAIAADIRIAADDVKIGFNQVTLGIVPAWAARSGSRRRSAAAARCWRSRAASSTTPRPRCRSGSSTSSCRAPRSTASGGRSRAASRPARRGTARAAKALVAPAVPAVHAGLEANATDVFARLWTADAHWDAVEAMEQRRRTG